MTCPHSGTGQVGGVGMTYDVSIEWYGSSGWCWDDRMTCPQSGTGQVGGVGMTV